MRRPARYSSRLPRKKSDLEWLQDHLAVLLDTATEIQAIEPAVFNSFGAWTTLKLIGVKYWQRVYTDIIQDNLAKLGKNCMAYLDVMAGSGLNRIREVDCTVAGSSILAAVVPKKPFHHILSIERQKARAEALERRLEHFRPRDTFQVLPDEADDVLPDALGELRDRNAHFMAFVDYEGMKGFSRRSMDALLAQACDIWFTYFPNIRRSFVLSEWDDANLETCRNFFGRELVDNAITYEDLIASWTRQLTARRPILYPFHIQSGEGYSYELVFMTRRTKRGSPYTNAADQLESRLSSIKGDFAEMVLRILSGTQQSLDAFTSGRPPSSA